MDNHENENCEAVDKAGAKLDVEMVKRTMVCPCGATKEIEVRKNSGMYVGKVAKETGWMPVFADIPDCLTIWVCPVCAETLHAHALAITQIVRNPNVSLRTLLSREEVKMWEETAQKEWFERRKK